MKKAKVIFDKIPAYRPAGLLSFHRLEKKEPARLEDKSYIEKVNLIVFGYASQVSKSLYKFVSNKTNRQIL